MSKAVWIILLVPLAIAAIPPAQRRATTVRPPDGQMAKERQLRAGIVHKDAVVVGLHCDTIGRFMAGEDLRLDLPQGHVDIPKLKRGAVDLQVFACFAPPPTEAEKDRARKAFDQIDAVLQPPRPESRRPRPRPVGRGLFAASPTPARPVRSSASKAATPLKTISPCSGLSTVRSPADDADPLDPHRLGRRFGRPQRSYGAHRIRQERRPGDEHGWA